MKQRVWLSFVVLMGMLVLPLAGRGQWVQTNGPLGGTVSQVVRVGSKLVALAAEGMFSSEDSGLSWHRLYHAPAYLNTIATVGDTIVASGNADFEPFFAQSTDGGISWNSYYGVNSEGGFVANGNCLYVIATGDVIPSPTVVEISTNAGQSWNPAWDSIGLYPKGRILGLFGVNTDLYAESDSGIYRSRDSGKSWTDVSGMFPPFATAFFTPDSELFARTNPGLLRSLDGGVTWTDANAGLGSIQVNNVVEFGTNLLVWADSGLYVSTNKGASWNYTGQQPHGSYAIFVYGQTVLAGVLDSGIYRSSDIGESWKHVGLNCAYVDHFATIDSTVFIATHDWSYHGQIWRSPNDGANWQIAVDSMFSIYLFNPVWCLASVGKTLYATGSNDYNFAASTDKGNSWKPLARNQQGIQLGMVDVLLARNDTLYTGTDSYGIFLSTDSGMTWRLLDSTLYRFELNKYTYALTISGPNILAGTNDTGVFLSTDNGASWVPSNTGLSNSDIYSFSQMGRYVFAATGGGVYRSSDHGLSWHYASNGLNGSLIGSFAVIRGALFGSSGSGIFLSTDSGGNWQNVVGNLPDSNVSELLLSGSNLYAGTQGDGVWRRPLSDFGISSVSTQPIASTESITAYPNPATNSTTLRFPAPEGGDATVTVMNALGVSVMRNAYRVMRDASVTLDLSSLPAGMYECVVQLNGEVHEVPIILR